MNGPGQFITRFEANLTKDDIWSNDITEDALKQRKADDIKTVKDWLQKKKDNGWENGIPQAELEKYRDSINAKKVLMEEFLPKYYEALDKGDAAAHSAAVRILKTDEDYDYANDLLNYIGSNTPNRGAGRLARYQFFLDNFSVEYWNRTLNGLQFEYDASESLVADLPGKTYENGLTKLGSGTLRLTGNSTYTGETWVNGGLLAVDGSLTSKVLVNDSGILGGIGRVGALVANQGGTVAPGNSIGTLTVTGDATFNKGSVYAVEVAGASSDQLAVEGKAMLLGGVVLIKAEGGPDALTPLQILARLGQSHTILTAAGGVSGSFDAAVPMYRFIGASLGYDAKAVNVTLARNGLAFADFGRTVNERATARGIESQGLGHTLHDGIAVSQVTDDLGATYAGLVDDVQATLNGVLVKDAGFVSRAATDRLRAAFDGVAAKPQPVIAPLAAFGPEKPKAKGGEAFAALHPEPAEGAPVAATTALWGEAYGAWSHADGDGYGRNIGGFITGLDGIVDTWRMGVLAGYGNTSFNGHGSSASVDSYQIGLYGGTEWDRLGLRFGAALAQNEIDTDRTAVFGGLANSHDASYDAKTVQVFGELGYRIDTAYAALEPFAAASHVHLKTDGFQEDGAISNLTGLSGTTDLTTTTLGLRASHDFTLSETTTLTARGMLGWSHAFGDVTPQQRLAFAGGQAFTIEGLPIAQDTAIVEAGFDVGIGRNKTVGLSYTGQFSSQTSDNAVKADLTVRF